MNWNNFMNIESLYMFYNIFGKVLKTIFFLSNFNIFSFLIIFIFNILLNILLGLFCRILKRIVIIFAMFLFSVIKLLFSIIKNCSYITFNFLKLNSGVLADYIHNIKFKCSSKNHEISCNDLDGKDIGLNAIFENNLLKDARKRGKNKTYEKIESFISLNESFLRMHLPVEEFFYSYR
jgi:hypothetical protein